MKDLEHRANLDAEALGLPRPAPQVGPECVLGLELNPFAAELARVSTWIAEIQWMRRNGFDAARDPILKPLDTISCVDALLDWGGADTTIPSPRRPGFSPASAPTARERRAEARPADGGGADESSPAPDAPAPAPHPGLDPGPRGPKHAPSTRPTETPDPGRATTDAAPRPGLAPGPPPAAGAEPPSGSASVDGGPGASPGRTSPALTEAPTPTRRRWPEAEFIVGNPPFLGNKKMVAELGEAEAATLRRAWGDVPGGVDLVAYWVAAAWEAVAAGRTRRAGLVTTNSIRGGANRAVLAAPAEAGAIFEAWSDEPWTVAGAAVRVSMVMFGEGEETPLLDGAPVERIAADLTAGLDLTGAVRLRENADISYQGVSKVGQFELTAEDARAMLKAPTNPNGETNAHVLRPWINGSDITKRSKEEWVVDFGTDTPLADAMYFEKPFSHIENNVFASRMKSRRDAYREKWWIHGEARPGMRRKLTALSAFIVTPKMSKHRFFQLSEPSRLPANTVIVVARDDYASFGVLSSVFHELWSLKMGQWLGAGNDPTYTPSTTFETYPFPDGLTPDIPASAYADDPRARAIAAAARDLDERREAWLNPPDLVRRVPEVVPGYPDRLLPVDDAAAKVLKTRTLTNLYNARPAWLAHLHARLDRAVAAAYGWPEDLADDDALARLLALNRARSG